MKADEAARQEPGDLGQALGGGHAVGVEGIGCRGIHRHQSR